MNLKEKLLFAEKLIKKGLDSKTFLLILENVLGLKDYLKEDDLLEMKIYSDYLPVAEDLKVTQEQRFLHFLWDALDRSPLAIAANFAILFRRLIAEKLFKKCGVNFIAEENVRFNFGQNIEVGNNVFWNRGVFIDSKGGVKCGDSSALAEGVVIFTHGHSESKHKERSYALVEIDSYAKVYAFAVLLPGVHVKKQAIVAAKSLVTKNVEENSMVAGIPAKYLRERDSNGLKEEDLEHIWLHKAAFQE